MTAAPVLGSATPRPILRRGRHRNKALAAFRRVRAVELATQGYSYEQIKNELGYANRGTVHRIVQQALQAQQVASVDEHRDLEWARLDALQASLWPRMEQGDLAATRVVLRVIQARCRLLGLYEPSSGRKAPRYSTNCGPETVIVHVDDCRHDGCWEHGKFESPGPE